MENEALEENELTEDSEIRPARIQSGADLTFRDDQHDFYWLLDVLRMKKKNKGGRFRLIDSGVFDVQQLEDLILAGADIYTSDQERKSSSELAILLKPARKSGSIVAFFIHGDLPEDEEPERLSPSSLSLLGKDGLVIHISNRERERKISDLILMAVQCRLGSGRLVYYHHGPFIQELITLGKEGVWIHISEKSLKNEQETLSFLDFVVFSRTAGAGGVIHIEKDMDPQALGDVLKAGAFVQFKTSPKDFKSPLRPYEDEARKKKLDFRAYYLSSLILP